MAWKLEKNVHQYFNDWHSALIDHVFQIGNSINFWCTKVEVSDLHGNVLNVIAQCNATLDGFLRH